MNPFTAAAGLPLGLIDRIAVAFQDTLAGNEKLKAWAEGRVNRGEMLALPDGIQVPQLIVGTLAPAPVLGIGDCTEMSLPVGVAALWAQPREFLSPEDGSVNSLWAEIVRSILGNYYLKVPRYSNQRLHKRLENVRPLGEPIFQTRVSDVVIAATLVFDFRVDLDTRLWDLPE